tara:strand:- start:274 stop:537 length:264 start_codon:yes stop_codon:yes gene_type:complete
MHGYLNKKQEPVDWDKFESMGWASAQSYLRDAILDLHERLKILEKANEDKQRSTESSEGKGAGKYVPQNKGGTRQRSMGADPKEKGD